MIESGSFQFVVSYIMPSMACTPSMDSFLLQTSLSISLFSAWTFAEQDIQLKKTLAVALMNSPQLLQFLVLDPHCVQAVMCPHGRKIMPTLASLQILHVCLALSRAFSLTILWARSKSALAASAGPGVTDRSS